MIWNTRGFLPLFLCNFAILFVGFGVFPLLPVYAARFGATPTLIGFYLAATYLAITLGTLLTGWLSGRVPRKVVFVTAGVLGVLALFLMGQATTFWQVVLLTGVVWFTGGIGLSLVSVFIGLHAERRQPWQVVQPGGAHQPAGSGCWRLRCELDGGMARLPADVHHAWPGLRRMAAGGVVEGAG